MVEKITTENLTLEVLASELEMEHKFSLNGLNVGIRGFADRVDRLQGQLRITDYKTGKFEKDDISVNELSTDLRLAGKTKALQLLTYAWLYWKNYPETESVLSGIWSFRKMNDGLVTANINGQEVLDIRLLEAHGQFLETLLTEIANPNTIFDQTTDAEICKNCNFRQICQR